MDLDFVCVHAGRTASALTRRDVARALLAVPSVWRWWPVPDLRREMMAAGNPLSLTFWDTARRRSARSSPAGRRWGTCSGGWRPRGTEPLLLTPQLLRLARGGRAGTDRRGDVRVWSPIWRSGWARGYRSLRAGPAVTAAPAGSTRTSGALAQQALPDGRVPVVAVGDEQDEELFAAWDEEEAFALSDCGGSWRTAPERPVRAEGRGRPAPGGARTPRLPRQCAEGVRRVTRRADARGRRGTLADRRGGHRRADLRSGRGAMAGGVRRTGQRAQPRGLRAGRAVRDPPRGLAGRGRRPGQARSGVLASPERIARLIAESEDIDVAWTSRRIWTRRRRSSAR